MTVCHISSTTVTRRLHMISSETGSASISAIASASGVPGVTRACGGAATPIAMRKIDGSHRRAALSPGGMTVVASRSSTIAGPGDAVAGRERVAIVDRRIDEAAVEPGLRACPLRCAGGRRIGGLVEREFAAAGPQHADAER